MDLNFADVPKYIFPIFGAALIVEYLNAKHHFKLKESLAGFAVGAGTTFIAIFTKAAAVAVFYVIFEWTEPLRISLLGYDTLGWAGVIWLIAIICDDFSFYWFHRLSHSIRILWAIHIPHHSSKTYNLTIGIRNGWFVTLYKPIFWIWMAAIGFEPIMIGSCLIINSIYQYFLHTQLVPSLPWIERIFNTPFLHQVHHSKNIEYLDMNHGGILIIWDRMFGTFKNQSALVKPEFGVIHDPNSFNPIKIHTHEFEHIYKDVRSTSNWLDKLKYLFYPPGWSHDGRSKTTRALQKELSNRSQSIPQLYTQQELIDQPVKIS